MKRINSIAITFLTLALAASQVALAGERGGHEGGTGGGVIQANFISMAQVIFQTLKSAPEEADILTSAQMKAFGSAIEHTNIKPIIPDGPFTDNHGNTVNARIVADKDQPGRQAIELDANFWKDASPTDVNVCRVVFHEYLRVIGVDQGQDEDHYAVSHRWNKTCDFYVGVNVRNMDFLEGKKDWFPCGFGGYKISEDKFVGRGNRPGSIKITAGPNPAQNDFGGIGQCVDAKPMRGKRIRLTGYLKIDDVQYSGLWVRVDEANGAQQILDNMYDRPLRGTLDWTPAIVELPVVENSGRICFGALMSGTGVMWADHLRLEIVD
jgi:hypothetical protein